MPDFGTGRGTLTASQSVLSTAASKIIPANQARLFAEVKNADAAINIYIGGASTLTTANGHLLKPSESFAIQDYEGDIWAIAASGTPTATIIEW